MGLPPPGAPRPRAHNEGPAGEEGPVGTQADHAGSIVREVRDEMRQVAWPSRSELINYTSVVLTTLIIMISLIFVLNLAFGKLITLLFTK